jgi:4-carboxymuconolactone decarboxylase
MVPYRYIIGRSLLIGLALAVAARMNGAYMCLFADRAKLNSEQVRATFRGDPTDPAWTDEERLLIKLVDELHDTAGISDELWNALYPAFRIEEIFELIALVGFYHTISFFANGLRLPNEPYAVLPPDE